MGANAIFSSLGGNRRRSVPGMISNASPSLEINGIRGMHSGANEKHLKVAIDDEPTNGSLCNSEVISPSFFGRPFNAGALQQSKWNPFKKKSGILGVIHAQAKRNRVVSKHGKLNTFRRPEENDEQHRYLKDFFTSMIDLPWSWTLLSFGFSFFFSWLLFAAIWYIIALIHGDLTPLDEREESHKPCVDNIQDFTSCFLFSIETQHTIGYGVRATTEQCPGAIIIMSIQCIVGVVIQACMAGIVFAKFTKPTMRAETILFSKNALITMRNGFFYLVCRIGDLRPTHLLESHVSGQIVKREVTDEGEEIPYHMERMEFGAEIDGTQDFFQMFWPITVSHKIDEESPLYEMSPRDILQNQFEIILTMEGITPETGNTIQVRTSYLPNEILWGYRFEHSCVSYDKETAKYAVSLTNLNKFHADKTPRCSAKEWDLQRVKLASSTLSVAGGTEAENPRSQPPSPNSSSTSSSNNNSNHNSINDKEEEDNFGNNSPSNSLSSQQDRSSLVIHRGSFSNNSNNLSHGNNNNGSVNSGSAFSGGLRGRGAICSPANVEVVSCSREKSDV